MAYPSKLSVPESITTTQAALGAAGLLVLYYIYKFFSLGSRNKAYPPGPKTLPLLGNVHLIPQVATEKHVYYDKLAQEYGDVFTLKVRALRCSRCLVVLMGFRLALQQDDDCRKLGKGNIRSHGQAISVIQWCVC